MAEFRRQFEVNVSHEILNLCIGDRAPFGLIEFPTGIPEEGHDRPVQSSLHRRRPVEIARSGNATSMSPGAH